MILTQLKPLRSPLLDGKTLQKTIINTHRRLRTLVRAQIRRVKSRARAYIRSQYYVSTAVRDTRVAVRHNEDIFIATIMALFAIGYSTVATLVDFLLLFLQTALSVSELTGTSITILAIIACGVCGILLSWIAAGLFSAQSIAVMEGATRRQNRSLRATTKRGLELSTRVTTTWLIMAIILLGPVGLTASGAMLYLISADADFAYTLQVLSYVSIAAIAWVIVAATNIALAPLVAVFEINLSYKQIFVRSYQLIKRRGRIFLLGTAILTALALGASYGIAYFLETLFAINKWLPFSAFALAVLAMQNSILTVLYRKRKLARKN